MNDDQIRSELERRAGSAQTKPDWAKRVLLPAMWHEIDARPQPVVTSRWPSLAGATALVVALLVLVVAIPRLAPQPPSSTTSPGTASAEPPPPPGVLTTAQFASRLAAGDLAGRTVLVDGSISVSTRRGQMCIPYEPEHHCYLGTLDGVQPPIDIWARTFPTTESGSGATWSGPGIDWSWWTGPDAVSGVLVLSVAEDGQVDFIGPVRQAGAGLSWTVAEAAELAIETVEPEQVILVDGWLDDTPAGDVRFCPAMPFPDPTLDGLPSRFCAPTDSLRSQATGDGELPRGSLMWVQQDAADQYGEGPGLYAVSPRLYGGGCDGQPPCWLWDVVARLDDAPIPEPTPAPTPAPTPPTPAMTHTCGGNGLIQLIDHAGLIESCAANTVDYPEAPIVLSDASQGVVRIVYSDACAGASSAELHLWARDDVAWPSQRPYVLNVDVQSPRAPLGCRSEMVGVQVVITFMNASLAPASLTTRIEAFLTTDGRGIDSVVGGSISLDIAADKSVYTEGEAIGVTSSLVSETELTLTCPFGPHIILEQLDGPLSFASGPFILKCSPAKELRAGEKITSEFSANGWGYSEPNPLEPYVRDGRLYLPPGTYRFGSTFGFGFGEILDSEHAELDVSVVIRVEPAPAVEPNATPTTAVDCSPTFLLLDETGLVESCSEWTPEPGQSGVSQGPDASSVFVAWTYSYCRGAPFARFEQAGDRYVFELGHLGTLPTVWPSCEPVTRTVGIAVRFTQPLDVGLIDAVSEH